MANNKIGLAYYNVDTDRYQDIRIKRLKKECGCSGIAVYDYLLCEIYRVKGCFIEWDASTAFDVAEYFGLKETTIEEIVNYCCHVGLFDKGLRTSRSILTSSSIQRRYVEMCRRAKRNEIKIPPEVEIIPEECAIIPEECNDTSGSLPQSKVKESKVNKSSKREAAIAAMRAREKEFYDTLVPYVEQYGKDMIREFYNYWTEPNKSGTKMNFEMQQTWDTARRLARWASRENDFKPRHASEEPPKKPLRVL